MPEAQQPKVFVSYAHQDGTALAQQLLKDLTKAGCQVWLDSARLEAGAVWTIEIEQFLDRSDVVVALLSRGSYVSETCRAEQLRSLRKGKCVIPAVVQADADRPIHLESKQYLDFSNELAYEAELAELLKNIRSRSGATLNERFYQTYVTVPPLPPNYVERSKELYALRAMLMRESSARRVALTALKGMAGIGKTVLAQALCLDEITQAAFPDGIIWLVVGKEPRDLVPLLREAGKATGDALDGYDSVQAASNRLRNHLREKAVLLVLDDVWDPRDVAPFLVDSPTSRILITTRDASAAVSLGARQTELSVLTQEQAIDLILLWSDCPPSKLPAQAFEIVQECGCLPLAVAMVGAQLRGKPDRWSQILEKLRNADLERIRQVFPEYPHPNLVSAIEVSVETLAEGLRNRYLDFAVFPEDSAIPERAVCALWLSDGYDVTDSIDQIVDLSLATRGNDGRLKVHDLLLDYLRRRLGADALVQRHRGFLDSYARQCPNCWSDGSNDGYFFEYLIWHLRKAGRTDEALGLLTNFRWMEAKLKACGITTLLSDYEWFAPRDGTARLVQEALRLAAYVLATDQPQLAGQLLARIISGLSPQTDRLREEAELFSRGPWLKPIRCLLTPPGGALMFTLAGHTARIRSVALTPDGARAVSACDDQTLRVWNLRRGVLERTLTGHTDAIRAVAILPEDARVVSASDDHTLRVWDLSSGAQEACIDTQLDWIRGVVALPGPARVASISDDRTIKIWDLQTARVAKLLRGHTAEINCLAMTADGKSLISGADDRTIRIWPIQHDGIPEVLKGHGARIIGVAASAAGQIISVSADGTAQLWNNSPKWQSSLMKWRPRGVRNVTFAPDGYRVIAGGDDSNVHIWEIAGESERILEGHSDWVNCVAVTPDNRYALSASDDGTLKLWDLGRTPSTPILRDHYDRVRAVAVTPDGLSAMSTSDDHTLRIWHLAEASLQKMYPNQHHWVFACTPTASQIVSSGSGGDCYLWDTASGRELQRFSGHEDRVRSLAVEVSGRRIVSGGDDKTLRLWDVASAGELLNIRLTGQWPRAIAITPDGRLAITAAETSTIKAWDLETGAEVCSFRGHTARVNAVVIAASGDILVSGSEDHTLRSWDMAGGNVLHVMARHNARVNWLAALPGERLVMSASDDCRIMIWDVISGELVATFTIESPVLTCAAGSSPTRVVAGDRSGLVHFFEFRER